MGDPTSVLTADSRELTHPKPQKGDVADDVSYKAMDKRSPIGEDR
jgi:hypothetical protein